MPELRRLAADLLNRPVVGTPNIDAVQARAARYRQRRATQLSAAAVALTLVLGLVGVGLVDGDGAGSSQLRAADGGDLPVDPSTVTLPTVPGVVPGSTTTTTAGSSASTTTSTTSTTVGQPGPSPKPDPCPGGQNAGATDVGVTATEVRVSVSQQTMPYVSGYVNRINAEGGICGRRIVLATGGPEAFAHIPTSTTSGDRNTVVPVIGGDGAVKEQYESPWTWQVGTTTAAQARIMVKDAWDKGARTFGIVYDSQQRFGTAAHAAFTGYVTKLGGTVVRSQGVSPARASYTQEVQAWNDACGGDECDMVAFILDPTTAQTWMAGAPARGRIASGFPHMVMGERFFRDCGTRCDGFQVWTPWSAPIGELNADQVQFVEDVRSASPGADVNDPQALRSYIGARVLVAGLRDTGANLTRVHLRSALDSLTFASGLAPTLRWSESRYANTSVRPYEGIYASNSFAGFRPHGGYRRDPGA